jgi:hypothetical protein
VTKKVQFLAGLFLVCMCVLMLQIVETRILSVISFYHLAFFAISMAMSGSSTRSRPLLAARYESGGRRTPNWLPSRRYGLHHAIVEGDTAYAAWRDGGLVVLDVAKRAAPKLITHHNWSPPFGGGTHNCLPLPDRDLLIVLDEAVLDHQEDGLKLIWVFDIRQKDNPVSISTVCRQRRPFRAT